MVTLTAARNGVLWRLYLDTSPEPEHQLAEISNLPIPSIGDQLLHEDFDKPLIVTRLTWNIRADYPLEVDVYACEYR
jgi:hypothetical protein